MTVLQQLCFLEQQWAREGLHKWTTLVLSKKTSLSPLSWSSIRERIRRRILVWSVEWVALSFNKYRRWLCASHVTQTRVHDYTEISRFITQSLSKLKEIIKIVKRCLYRQHHLGEVMKPCAPHPTYSSAFCYNKLVGQLKLNIKARSKVYINSLE